MKYKVFIDGVAGTTGLQLKKRLLSHPYIELIEIDYQLRKDLNEKVRLAKEADITILCLPDNAAIETVKEFKSYDIRIIDASSAHRVDNEWVYGFPEMGKGQREFIQQAKYVSNPGCYPIGFLSLIRPLVIKNIIPNNTLCNIFGVSGYTGGGVDLIDKFTVNKELSGFCNYGFDLNHKHNKEMFKYSALTVPPIFMPSIANFPQGMNITVPIRTVDSSSLVNKIYQTYSDYYMDDFFIKVHPINDFNSLKFDKYLQADFLKDTNNLEIFTFHNPSTNTILLSARLDNLGKGASGNAVQCLNIMLGLNEEIVPNPM